MKSLYSQFWTKWSKEYLHTLQQRLKWTKTIANLKIGEMVLIVDPSLIIDGNWPLGRVTQVFISKDNLVRSAEIRTLHRMYTRPIGKLCRLPISVLEDAHKTSSRIKGGGNVKS